jgi:CBS domain-containing protein
MNKVRQLLKYKGHRVWTIKKEATVLAGIKLMVEKKIGSLLVVEDNKPVGIFTERDYARKVGIESERPADILIRDVMTHDLIVVTPEQTVRDCMQLLTENQIRHLPVVENDKVVGLISIGDVVRDLIEELEFHVEQLRGYITGLQ